MFDVTAVCSQSDLSVAFLNCLDLRQLRSPSSSWSHFYGRQISIAIKLTISHKWMCVHRASECAYVRVPTLFSLSLDAIFCLSITFTLLLLLLSSSMVFDFMTLCFQRESARAQYLLWCKRAFSIRLFSLHRSTASIWSHLVYIHRLVLHGALSPCETLSFNMALFWRHIRSKADFFIHPSRHFFRCSNHFHLH